MNSLTFILFFIKFVYSSAQCPTGNLCLTGGVYTPQNGYQCIQLGADYICTCPGGYERNMPCSICARSNPLENVCQNRSGKLIKCLEIRDYGTAYACLCSDGFGGSLPTTDAECDSTVTLTTPSITTVLTPSVCNNGGVLVGSICHCPSGYSGTNCGTKIDTAVCERFFCKNKGVAAIRNPNGPYECKCLCPYGTWGEYCELIGTLGSCSTGSCMNGGACKENVIGITRFAYCMCPAGYNGAKCETLYFRCPGPGKFVDNTLYDQGKYFECSSTLRAEQKSCPNGLRFNPSWQLCTY